MYATILVVDDNIRIFESLKPNFDHFGIKSYYAADYNSILPILKDKQIDVVLMDIMLDGENGIHLLEKIKKMEPSLPVIMITGFASIDTAVESMRKGAFDYVTKPLEFERLFNIIENAIRLRRLSGENRELQKRSHDLSPKIYAGSTQFQELFEDSKKLAKSDIPILLLGENGSGKEIIADYIHQNSSRASLRMHKINCSAFPESLLDNELFGHEKGSYTGADQEFKGVFERAHGSTLLLDEIGDMPLTIQSKILRVLQNNEIRRIGGTKTIILDVRFIAATNKDLEKLIEQDLFREDLYYRLNAATITAPPLRSRLEDIHPLSLFFLKEFSDSLGKSVQSIDPEVQELFAKYPWPGNVRELKNAINYAVAVTSADHLRIEDVPPRIRETPSQDTGGLNIREKVEALLIENALKEFYYNKKRVAEQLKMSRKTLYVKMAKYGIKTNK